MRWKTKSSKEVYRNKWMWITEDEVVTDAGKQMTYYVVHKNPFVLIIPWDGKEFTLVGQYRHPIRKFSWEFPQGHCEHNSIEKTALVELAEETGLIAKSIKQIGLFYLGPGHHSQKCFVFLATDLTQGETNRELGEEGMRLKKINLMQLEKMIKDGKLKDGPTLAAFSTLKNWI